MTVPAPVATMYSISRSDEVVVPVGELALGLDWEHGPWSAQLGYEFSVWFGMFDRIRFHDNIAVPNYSVVPTNVAFDGFFLRLIRRW